MKKIFLSYCWKNESIADLIDELFKKEGIKIIRDKHDLNYSHSIKEFMEQVRDADYVIMLISKEYLESVNCMYEVLEFIKDSDFKKRILPLVHQDTNIFKSIDIIDYIKFWEDEYNKLSEKAHTVSREASAEISSEIKKISNIKNTIAEFTSIIADMNNIIYNDTIGDKDFEKMIKVVSKSDVKEIITLDHDEIKNDEEDISFEYIYQNYINKWCEFADVDNWRAWTSWMLGSGQPRISEEMLEKLEELREWLFSRIWTKKYKELERSFENFRCVLNDLYVTFYEHCEKRGTMFFTEKFYKIDRWDPELYAELLKEFNFHVNLVQDLTLELTRAANYICDTVRKYVQPEFKLEKGKLLVTYGPCMDFSFRTICTEYKEEEKTLKPYPGLEEFKSIRVNRDHSFGVGTSSNDPDFLKSR